MRPFSLRAINIFSPTYHSSLQPATYRTALDQATHIALGPKAGRTRTTVAIDRYFKPVKPDTRCFNVASSLERQPTIVAPTAQLKAEANEDEVRKISSRLTSVSFEVSAYFSMAQTLTVSPQAVAPMAMLNMEQAPLSIQEPIRRRTEMLGLPRVGSVNNWAYQALQCNVAAVPKNSSGEYSRLHLKERALLTTYQVISLNRWGSSEGPTSTPAIVQHTTRT